MNRLMRSARPWWRHALLLSALTLAACSGLDTRQDACPMPQGHNLEAAFETAKEGMLDGCETRFDDYLRHLLTIAEGNPQPENRQRFSEFLVWASDEGLLSRRQAQSLYNRYFNVKFVSMMGDYDNCSSTCPNKATLLSRLERELADKELGLLRVSADKEAYYRADHLFKETELVLEATCSACAAGR